MLDSGIQEASGGVARYYLSENGRNKPISTEITGYAASALVYLFQVTGDEEYLDRAQHTARFLADCAWSAELQSFPFEHPSPSPESRHRAYFFDCGVIIRGLLSVWRLTQEQRLIDLAITAAHKMIADFRSGRDYHPILELPAKQPAPRTEHWSHAPGCYQLKAALAWREIAEITSDNALRQTYTTMLNATLASHSHYLPGSRDELRVMDRLHAYCYFLEGLTPVLDQEECVSAYRQGLDLVARYLRTIAPSFARSDVYAQLLRARIYAAEAIGIDIEAAAEEAQALAEFQAVSGDPRIDGGFSFGRRGCAMSPHINPVSTAFALQALIMWRNFQAEGKPPCRKMLI